MRTQSPKRQLVALCVVLAGLVATVAVFGAKSNPTTTEKRPYMPVMFSDADMQTHQLVRCAFDPAGVCNPGKVYPTPRLCGEAPGKYVPHPAELAGLAERF